jgi:tRNA dimethylallyltransferase
MKLPKIIVICGPTATGKSDLAVEIAKDFNGEIISADSRQVYKGLDVGSGKITEKEMRKIPHYLLDVASPKRKFSVAQFKKLGEKAIRDIVKRDKLPIICGGTGFYIDTLVYDLNFPEVKADIKLRKELNKKSLEELQKILKGLDKDRFDEIDIKNKVRLIRAIEIAKYLGIVPKLNPKSQIPNPKYDVLFIGIYFPDEILKQRILDRIHKRMKGMKKEVEKLRESGLSFKRMEELGLEYRNLSLLAQGKITEKEFVDKLYMEIWHFVKRQRTWFSSTSLGINRKDIHWLLEPNYENLKIKVEKFIKNKY